jgi:LDH2 family malate/lactate/ureidoglycolate dehydrogenase
MAKAADFEQRTYGQWWQSTEELVQAPLAEVRRVCIAALVRAGATAEGAAYLVDARLDKTLQGDHARGMGRFPGVVRAGLRGAINLNPDLRAVRETPATALVEGDRKAPNILVCRFAMDLAIRKAKELGVGWVGARAPAGILTPYVIQAVEAGMVGMVITQSPPTVAPLGGFRPILGNGPIAFGIPAGARDPIILDMSMTQSSASGVRLAAQQGQQVPEGFILDERGEPTTDANAFPEPAHLNEDGMIVRGSLLPLGGSHKAYAMIFVIGLLSAVLTDASPSWDVRKPGEDFRQGSIHVAIDPAAILPPDEFRRRVDTFIDHVRAAPKRAGVEEILYPGEMSQRLKRQRRETGLMAMPASHYRGLVELAQELGIEGLNSQ